MAMNHEPIDTVQKPGLASALDDERSPMRNKRPYSTAVAHNDVFTPAHRWGSSESEGQPTGNLKKRQKGYQRHQPYYPSSVSGFSSPLQLLPPALDIFVPIRVNQVMLIGRKLPEARRHGQESFITLPAVAKHASRVHAKLTLTCSYKLIIEIIGQNGLTIRINSSQEGEKLKVDEVKMVDMDVARTVSLDFYGCILTIEPDRSKTSSSLSSELDEVAPPVAPPSSPVVDGVQSGQPTPMLVDDDDECFARQTWAIKEDSDVEESEDEREDSSSPLSEPAQESLVDAATRAGVDLFGVASSELVFQTRATLSTAELMDLTGKASPQLLNMEAWSEEAFEEALSRGPFGVIDSTGLKDANGRALPKQWYYNADEDLDADRAMMLRPYAKAPRASQQGAAKRYVWPIPVLKRRR